MKRLRVSFYFVVIFEEDLIFLSLLRSEIAFKKSLAQTSFQFLPHNLQLRNLAAVQLYSTTSPKQIQKRCTVELFDVAYKKPEQPALALSVSYMSR